MFLVEVYYNTRATLVEFGDGLLLSTAFSISEHSISTGGDLLPENIQALIENSLNEAILYKVVGPDNAYISGFDGLPDIPRGRELEGGKPLFYDAVLEGSRLRVVALRYFVEDRPLSGWMSVFVAHTVSHREQRLQQAMLDTALRLFVLVIVTVALTWLGISQGLIPLTRLRDAISRRSYDDLKVIQRPMPREISPLVDTLNNLLIRLSDSIDKNRRFIANASHQLRTPVTALMAQAEQCLRKVESGEQGGIDEIQVVIDRAEQMSRLISQLLSLARVENSDQAMNQLDEFDLVEFAREVTIQWLDEHHTHDIDLGLESELSSLAVQANQTLIQEYLSNLIDNAANYCPAGAIVTVRIDKVDGRAVLEVEDNGPGIPEAERPRALERFGRLQEDRKGTGLGLAIASEVAKFHQAELSLHTARGGKGLLVRLEFPK
jgi:two-component system sensor histidine kinase TctE